MQTIHHEAYASSCENSDCIGSCSCNGSCCCCSTKREFEELLVQYKALKQRNENLDLCVKKLLSGLENFSEQQQLILPADQTQNQPPSPPLPSAQPSEQEQLEQEQPEQGQQHHVVDALIAPSPKRQGSINNYLTRSFRSLGQQGGGESDGRQQRGRRRLSFSRPRRASAEATLVTRHWSQAPAAAFASSSASSTSSSLSSLLDSPSSFVDHLAEF